MAKNFVTDGHRISWINSTGEDVMSGTLIVAGELAGIAMGNIAVGEGGVLALTGVWTLPAKTGAIAQGAAVFAVSKGEVAGTKEGDAVQIGTAFAAKGAGAQSCQVRLGN